MVTDPPRCPLCGVSSVTTKVEAIATRNGTIETRYAMCDACGSEVNPDDDDLFILDLTKD